MGYTAFDRFVAQARFRAAIPYIRHGAKVCDLGCGPGAPLLQMLATRISFGVGVDYQVAARHSSSPTVILADIRHRLPLREGYFDHAVMLAVLEHLREPTVTLQEAFRILVPGGSLIMTWPSQVVDPILTVLHRMWMISDEMQIDEHQRRFPLDRLIDMLRRIGFGKFAHRMFEFGLNNLLVAYKTSIS